MRRFKEVIVAIKESTVNGRKVYTTPDGKWFYTRAKADAHAYKSALTGAGARPSASSAGGDLAKWVAAVDKGIADAGWYEEQDEIAENFAEDDQSGMSTASLKLPTVRKLFSGRVSAKHKPLYDKLLSIFNRKGRQSVTEGTQAWVAMRDAHWAKLQDARFRRFYDEEM